MAIRSLIITMALYCWNMIHSGCTVQNHETIIKAIYLYTNITVQYEGRVHNADRQENEFDDVCDHVYRRELFSSMQCSSSVAWRIKWAQVAAATFGLIAMLMFIVARVYSISVIQTLTQWFAGIGLMSTCFLYFNNFSGAGRLLKEPNVIIIVVLTLCNCAIDILRPSSSHSAVNGFMYMLLTDAFVFSRLKTAYIVWHWHFICDV